MCEEFILNANRFEGLLSKLLKKMVAILSKFTVLGLFSYFVVYFSQSKLILISNRVVYHYT